MTPRDPLPPLPGKPSQFRMIDVGEKTATRRRAVAMGRLHVGQEAWMALRDKALPKGDALAMAEVAGIMAAKNTANLLPLCHQLGLDVARIQCSCLQTDDGPVVEVHCEVVTTAKTGVEMEALCGATAALLTIYDLTKGIDPALWISGVHLVRKQGGKSGDWWHPHFPEDREGEAAR